MSFKQPSPFFGGTTTFDKKFPQIADISVNVVEIIPNVLHPQEIPTMYSGIHNVPPQYPCQNPKCNGGGIDINQIIEEMVSKKETIYDKKRMCHGRETSPKGRKEYGGCGHDFLIKIKIEYKN